MNLFRFDGEHFYFESSLDWSCPRCRDDNSSDVSLERIHPAALPCGELEFAARCEGCNEESTIFVTLVTTVEEVEAV